MVNWDDVAQLVGYTNEEQMLFDMYHTHHLSISEIAEKLGSGKATIRRRMTMYELDRRTRGGANNKSNKRVLLHFLDQRYVQAAPGSELAHVINSHPSTVWKYLKES